MNASTTTHKNLRPSFRVLSHSPCIWFSLVHTHTCRCLQLQAVQTVFEPQASAPRRTQSDTNISVPLQANASCSLLANMYDDQPCSSSSFCLAHATQVLVSLRLEALEFHVVGPLAGAHPSQPATPSRQRSFLYPGLYTK